MSHNTIQCTHLKFLLKIFSMYSLLQLKQKQHSSIQSRLILFSAHLKINSVEFLAKPHRTAKTNPRHNYKVIAVFFLSKITTKSIRSGNRKDLNINSIQIQIKNKKTDNNNN